MNKSISITIKANVPSSEKAKRIVVLPLRTARKTGKKFMLVGSVEYDKILQALKRKANGLKISGDVSLSGEFSVLKPFTYADVVSYTRTVTDLLMESGILSRGPTSTYKVSFNVVKKNPKAVIELTEI